MFGRNFIDILKSEGIDTSNVTFTKEAPTSVASILVDNEGINESIFILKRIIRPFSSTVIKSSPKSP